MSLIVTFKIDDLFDFNLIFPIEIFHVLILPPSVAFCYKLSEINVLR